MNHKQIYLECYFWIVLLGVTLALTACGRPRAEVMLNNEVDCSSYIDELNEVLESWTPVMGVVAFPVNPVETGRAGLAGSPYEGYRFAKFGLVVRANRELKLEVPQTGNVLMEWGTLKRPNRPATSLKIGPCDGSGKDWLVFAGGLWVVETMCVPITVTSGEQREMVQVGVDTMCP